MTLDEFRDHLAENLGIKGDGNALSADRANYLETVIANCHGELEQLEVSLWSADDVPGYAIACFVLYCKSSLSAFGQEYDPRLKALALSQLRYLTADRRAGVGRATYF